VAGLLHTPQALVRRARISAGWTLIAGYWLYVVLMAALAWQVQGFFPTEDAPGKNGGLFGAAILLVIGTPLFAVGSGAVFREEPDTTTPRLREHIAVVTILCCTLTGLVAGLTFGYNFALPRNGSRPCSCRAGRCGASWRERPWACVPVRCSRVRRTAGAG
jgi:amino acid transporter